MDVFWAIILGIVFIFVVGIGTNLLCWKRARGNTTSTMPGWVTGIAVVLCIFSWLYVLVEMAATVPAHNAIVVGDRFVTSTNVIGPCVYWESMLPDHYDIVDLKQWQFPVTMRLNPITANPKVRDLEYEVMISGGRTPRESLALYRFKQRTGKAADSWLKYQLYELDEAKSKEMAGFYNPYDENQQKAFRQLVLSWLPPLPPGVKIDSIRFSLP